MAWVGHQLSMMRQGFVRVVGMFPELQFLVKGFISSFSAVFWGSILMWIATWQPIAAGHSEPAFRSGLDVPGVAKIRECSFQGLLL